MGYKGSQFVRARWKPAVQDGNAGVFLQNVVAGLQPEESAGLLDFIDNASFRKTALECLQMD